MKMQNKIWGRDWRCEEDYRISWQGRGVKLGCHSFTAFAYKGKHTHLCVFTVGGYRGGSCLQCCRECAFWRAVRWHTGGTNASILSSKGAPVDKRWILTRVYEVRNEIRAFLREKSSVADVLSDERLFTFSHLADTCFTSQNNGFWNCKRKIEELFFLLSPKNSATLGGCSF